MAATLGKESTLSDAWDRLALYESLDVVGRLFRKRHGLDPSAGKAAEIATCLAQGRQYFAAAERSGDLIAPLVLFYGVVSLTRGLVLFLNATARLGTLHGSHGISSGGWSKRLYGAPPSDAVRLTEALGVPVALQSSGTFPELIRATDNAERCAILDPSSNGPTSLRVPGPTDVQGVTVPLRDVLASIPDLRTVYERSLDERSRCYPASAAVSYHAFAEPPSNVTGFAIYETRYGLLSEAAFRKTFRLGTTIRVDRGSAGKGAHPFMRQEQDLPPTVGLWSAHWRHHDWSDYPGLPWPVKMDREGVMYMVPPLIRDLVVSTTGLLYLTAFAMGTFVRYFPTVWQSLMARSEDDLAFPLFRASVQIVERRFPELILMELENADWEHLQPGS